MNNEQCEMNNEQCTMNFARKKERATSNTGAGGLGDNQRYNEEREQGSTYDRIETIGLWLSNVMRLVKESVVLFYL